MTTATDLRVALVGAGYFARYRLDAWRRVPGARLAAVGDRDPARLARAAAHSGGAAAYTEACAMLAAESPDLVGWQINNGVLTNVNVMFNGEELLQKPLPEVAEVVIAVVNEHFELAPKQTVVSFSFDTPQ